ncbi:TonB-dependent receptor [Sphingomonas sp. GB1N7]|uniref:TonB-dependent receptor n=1 Tax=Parasphingomonas caseinilytica TaxID=3096158 RepID=UPI002FC5E5AF
MKHTNTKLAAIMVASVAMPAFAQTTVPPATRPEQPQQAADEGDIIVTAQKRTERLQDVPISITAVSGDQMAKQGIVNTADLAKVVPGFTFQNSAYGVPIFTIRGIGLYDNSTAISPTVSVYVDQVPLPYLVMTPGAALDVERVEVLKGPQGTLFGQNATGGAINYIAAKPTSTPEGGFDLSYGRFNAVSAQGYVSGPITDTLAVRVSAKHEYRDGWQKSETRPDDRLGKRDFSAGRIIVDWKPTSRFKLEINANGWQDKSDTLASQFIGFRPTTPPPRGYPESTLALAGRRPAPDNSRAADWDPNVSFRRDDWLYQLSARADWEVADHIDITSITAYTSFKTSSPTDSDGTDFNNFRRTLNATIKSISQELRASADLKAARITIGLNYQDDNAKERDPTTYVGSNSGVGPLRYSNFDNITDQRAKTYAVFGNTEIPLTETLTAQLGGRYTKQNRDYQGCLRDAGDGALAAAIALVPVLAAGKPYSPAPPGECVTLGADFNRIGLVIDTLDEGNVSWRGGLTWKPNRDTMVYGNVTRGYKAGAFTPLPAVFASQLTPVRQERVTAYEVGTKLSLLNRRIDTSLSAFYYDYANKQILGTGVYPPFGALPQLQNVPKSNVWGVELDTTIRPIDGLRLRVGGTYIKSRVSETYLTPDPVGRVVDIKGEAFPNAPRWQIVGDGEYGMPVGTGLKAYLGGNVSYRSVSNAAFGENPTFRLKPYTLVDLRVGLGSQDDAVTVELWGRNVLNTFYWTNVNYAIDSLSRAPGMPGTYGITLRSRF